MESFRVVDLRLGMISMIVEKFPYLGIERTLLDTHASSILSRVFDDLDDVCTLDDVRERLWIEWTRGSIFYQAVAYELLNFVSQDEIGDELRNHYAVTGFSVSQTTESDTTGTD